MPQFADYLVDIISDGHVEQALHLLRTALTKYKNTHKDGEDAHIANDLSNQVVMLSSRYQELERHEAMGTISADNAKIERSSITYSLLEIANTLSDYAHFLSFADELSQHKIPVAKFETTKRYRPAAPAPAATAPAATASSTSRTLLWAGVGAVAMLILIVVLALGSDPATPDPAQDTTDPATESTVSTADLLVATWYGEAVEPVDGDVETKKMAAELAEIVKKIVYVFNADGSMHATIGDNQYNGKYTLSQDGTTLTIDDGESTDTYHIEEITAKGMYLSDLPNKHVILYFSR